MWCVCVIARDLLKLWLTWCFYAMIIRWILVLSLRYGCCCCSRCMQHPIFNMCTWVYIYGKYRHTHQSARLKTIIYNTICNLFVDSILVCSRVLTFYYICIDCTFITYESRTVQWFNAQMCIHGMCYSCGIKCILYVSISLTPPVLLLSFGMLCDFINSLQFALVRVHI